MESVTDDLGSEDPLRSQFLPWIDPISNVRAPAVLVGAGLSVGLAPTAGALASEIVHRKVEIERALAVSSPILPDTAANLYVWAGDCLAQLVRKGHTEIAAKLLLADAMGITVDPRFLAQAKIPLRGTTPRHRVLSRLAREGRVEVLWSFNWDCWLEAALESVGFRRGDRLGTRQIVPLPWKLRYHVWFGNSADAMGQETVPLFKAHGCIRALREGKSDFVISQQEMDCEQPEHRVDRMKREISSRWMVALGWSATEPYVQQLLANLKSSNALGERLTIVDVDARQPGHLAACESFGCTLDVASVQVNGSTPGTTDDLFMWIQAHRGIESLLEACSKLPDLRQEIESVARKVPQFNAHLNQFWCVSFVDSWLPIWLRTCFMVSAQDHATAQGEAAEILPTEERDAHIPWGSFAYERHDLQAAARLLKQVNVDANLAAWDFDTFPGAFWNRRDQVMIFPVPIWTVLEDIAAISLKPIIDSVHWADKGRIRTLKVLPVETPLIATSNQADRSARLSRWKESLSMAFNHPYLATADNIQIIEIEELSQATGAGETYVY